LRNWIASDQPLAFCFDGPQAARSIDPSNSGEGDTTVDEQSAVLRANDIIKRLQAGTDFTTLAQQYSEDQSKLQNGELGYISEDDMKQSFPEQLTTTLMNPQTDIGKMNIAIQGLQAQIDAENKAIVAGALAIGVGLFALVVGIALAPVTGGASLSYPASAARQLSAALLPGE